ncbi:MAG: hypothetical protein STSR0008_12090 [Ignavibacterium sp.]
MVKKAVLFLNVPPPYGGGEIVNYQLAEIIKKHYKVIRFSSPRTDKSSQGKVSLINIFKSLQRYFVIIIYVIKKTPNIVFIGLGKSRFVFYRDSLIAMSCRLLGSKVIGDLHGMGFDFIDSEGEKNKIFTLLINQFSAIRVLSSSIEKELKQIGYKGNTYIIDNGIQKTQISYKSRSLEQPLKIYYLGSLCESKGVLDCLNLLSELRKNDINVQFTFIGEWVNQKFKEKVYRIVKNNMMNSYVIFKGRLLDEQKWDTIKNMHFLVHLSSWDGQPLTILEAMSIGIPSISTNIGAIPDTIIHNKTGFICNNYGEANKYLISILEDPKIYKKLSSNCLQEFDRRFTINNYANKIMDMIKNEANISISKNR